MISQPNTLLSGNFTKRLFAVLLFAMCFGKTFAQGWERFYGGNKVDRGHAIIQTIDRGFLMVGFSESFGTDNDQDVYVVKTDVDGTLVWTNVYDESFIEQGNSVIQADNGDLIIVGTIKDISASDRDLYVLSISSSGKFLWSKRFGEDGDEFGKDITKGVDGGYVIIGETTTTLNGESDFFVLKIDDQGNEIWSKTIGTDKDDVSTAITTINDGYAFTGFSENPNGFDNDVAIYRITGEGEVKWSKPISSNEIEEGNDIITTRDGGLAIVGNITNNRDVLITKYDDTGKRLWLTSFGDDKLAEIGVAVTELGNGDLVVAGHAEQNQVNVDFFMAGFSANGDSLWSNKTGDIVNVDFTEGIVSTDDGGFAIVGYNSKFLDSFNDLTLVKTDGRGNTITSFIVGQIFSEPCNNFEPSGKLPLSGWLVEAVGEEKTYYGSTDEEGRYSIRVDEGRYAVNVLPVNSYWKTCVPGGFLVNIEETYDTTEVNFPISAEINCPFLEVDISTPFLATCSDIVYTVNYCNLGTAITRDAYIEVQLDEVINFESSSKPFSSQEGSKYIFDLGALGVSQCGSFTINTSLPCDGIAQGQAALARAHIFPDSICTEPDPNWDGSSIIVGGECQGDSISFLVKNVGQSDMASPKSAIIIASDVIFLKHDYQLDVDEAEFIKFPKTGDTYRIIAEQSDGHPGRSYPTLAIEGCTPEEGGSFETGLVTQFPENDQDPYISIDAKEILSFDEAVNLRGYPKGYGADAYIAPNTNIQYTITFSNNETSDTISRVVVRDTLPAGLDISTLMPGASSHPYKFEVYDEGIVKFTFDNISLVPESSADNQSTSMGYVSFYIAQNPDNESGVTINNSAAIFFENHAPVFSNVVTHTVGEFPRFVEENVSVAVPDQNLAGVKIKVQPNPFVESTTFEIETTQTIRDENVFELYDLTGKLLRSRGFDGTKFEFHRNDLPAGMYFYRMLVDGRRGVSSGKIMIQ